MIYDNIFLCDIVRISHLKCEKYNMRIVYIYVFTIILLLIISQIDANTKINFYEKFNPRLYRIPTITKEIRAKSFLKRAKYGRIIAHKTSIVICCLARNISKVYNKNRKRLTFIGKQFNKYKIIIFENDSEDSSRELLLKWSKEDPNVILLKCCEMGDCKCKLKLKKGYDLGMFSKKRINNMLLYRDKYLNYVKKFYNNYNYMLVVDFDLNGSTNINGLFNSLSYQNWNAIFINGRNPIPGNFGTFTKPYDGMAYIDINDNYNNTNQLKYVYNVLKMAYLIKNNKRLIPVKSAFNGYGLYKIKSILQCSYKGDQRCEHINLAKCMNDKGMNLFINPQWIGYFNQQAGGPFDILKSMLSS
jgi:hypothetical protein